MENRYTHTDRIYVDFHIYRTEKRMAQIIASYTAEYMLITLLWPKREILQKLTHTKTPGTNTVLTA